MQGSTRLRHFKCLHLFLYVKQNINVLEAKDGTAGVLERLTAETLSHVSLRPRPQRDAWPAGLEVLCGFSGSGQSHTARPPSSPPPPPSLQVKSAALQGKSPESL